MGVYTAFAELLSYPGPGVLERVDECIAQLSPAVGAIGARHGSSLDATAVGQGGLSLARDLLSFRADVARLGLPSLEEAYTRAFDLEPGSCLYVGHHVFGETTRRSVFMARLAAMYREAGGPDTTGDLPDYLPLVLRYLDANLESTASRELLADAVVPALDQVLGALAQVAHAYTPVVRALLACARTNAPESSDARGPV